MENVDLESENRSELHFDDVAGGSEAVRRALEEVETVAPADSIIRISGENGTRRDALYRAVMALSRSIAGCTDLRSLLAGAAESLRQIVSFDHVALILHDSNGNAMQGHILNEPCNPVITSLRLPVDQDPAGWVWLNQRPLVVTSVQSETRWPEFVRRARDFNITTLILVPLTTGNNRLGAFGFSSVALLEPSPAEIAFLERVASEFAVAVESFLAKQAAVRERDRLRTLFDITDALVSKLDRDELFSAISDQLSKVIRHDSALLTLCNETGSLDVYALHSTIPQLLEPLKGPFNPVGMPAEEVLASGKPVVAGEADIDRYPNPNFRRFLALGYQIHLLGSIDRTKSHHRNAGAQSNDRRCLDFRGRRVPGAGREPDCHDGVELTRFSGAGRNQGAARYREALPGRRDPPRPEHREHGRRRARFSIRR